MPVDSIIIIQIHEERMVFEENPLSLIRASGIILEQGIMQRRGSGLTVMISVAGQAQQHRDR